jgi:prepilin-type N-terminal cleavage/methylation domain-containing protein
VKKKGFTLLEISIVLVVIGMIVGAVLIGRDMLQDSRRNSLLADAERVRTAVISFKQKYGYYPGDLPNATTFWGANTTPAACDTAGNTSNNATSTTQTATTCDGRGNGVIGMYWSDATLFPSAVNIDLRELREKFTLWQHLANAGFIEGQYSGYSSSGSSNNAISPGVNVLKTRYNDAAGFTLEYWNTINTSLTTTRDWPVAGKIGHLFSWSDPATGIGTAAMITSIDAYAIDNKIDDGLPYTGKVFTFGSNAQATTYGINSCVSSSAYNIASPTQPCAQYIRLFLEQEGG